MPSNTAELKPDAPKDTSGAIDKEAEGLGLDIGEKRRKPRKKKGAVQAQVATAETAPSQTTPSEIKVTELAQPIAEIAEQMPQPGQSGGGWGRGGGSARPLPPQSGPWPPQMGYGEPGAPGPRPSTGRGRGHRPGHFPQSVSSWGAPQPIRSASSTPMSPSEPQTFGGPSQAPQPKYIPVSTVSQSTFGKKDLPSDQQTVSQAVTQYKIPDAIRRGTVPSRAIRLLTNYLPMTINYIKVVSSQVFMIVFKGALLYGCV